MKIKPTDIVIQTVPGEDRQIVSFANGTELGDRFLKTHIFKEFIKAGRKEVAHWKFDSKTLDRSKYMPHQSERECARRLWQCL